MSGTEPIYILMFTSGLFGGFGHCIGMCGPLVAGYTMAIGMSPIQRLMPHLVYHSGRLMSYSIIGGFAGLGGSFVTAIKPLSYVQSIAMAVAGILIISIGISIVKAGPSRIGHLSFLKPFINLSKRVSETGGIGSLFPLGLINGLIPCGLSYTAFIAAMGIGAEGANPVMGFIKGVFMLLLFGLGTVPSLLLLSQFVSKITGSTRRRLYRISGVLLIIAGIVFIYRAIRHVY